MANLSNSIEIFLELAKIPSPSGKEEKIRNFILNFLSNYKFNIFVDKIGNIFIKTTNKNKNPLLLCAHIDTVEPTGFQNPIIKNERIFSNGKFVLGADNKVAVAVILYLLKQIGASQLPSFPLEIIFTVKEETEGGIRYFPKRKISAKDALVVDVSQPIGTVMIAAPYVGGYAFYVNAPGCHVAKMEKNTPHPLNFFTQFVKKITIKKTEDTIINIAKIRMGESYNSVPQQLYFTGEIRTFFPNIYNIFFKTIKKVAKDLEQKTNVKTKIEFYPYCQGYQLKNSDLSLIKKTFQKLNIKYQPLKAFSVGDFNILNQWGIKTINIGNGAENVHTTYESISFLSIKLLEKILDEYIKSYFKSG